MRAAVITDFHSLFLGVLSNRRELPELWRLRKVVVRQANGDRPVADG